MNATMSENIDLDEYKKVSLDVDEVFEEITGEEKEFPKYTTQLINIANQNAQATRPKVVGQMSELINECPYNTYEGWKEWYKKNYPNAIDKATKRTMNMIKKMRKAMKKIDEEMVREWVEDLVIDKTAEGLIIQEFILKSLAEKKGVDYRLAKPEEESKGIDGYLGGEPVSVKPKTYLSKKSSVRESIDVKMVFYKETNTYLHIFYKDD